MKKSILTLTAILAAALLQAAPLTWEGCDKNKDGVINMDEWLVAQKSANPKANPKNHAKWFKNWDADKNGKITKKEFETQKAAKKKENQAKAKAKKK